MTTRRPVRRHPFVQPAPTPEPQDIRASKASNLEQPGPGIVVSVPLGLPPEYLQLYQLAPMSKGDVRDLLERTGEPRRQVLYVKRITK